MLGYTQQELLEYFADRLDKLAETEKKEEWARSPQGQSEQKQRKC